MQRVCIGGIFPDKNNRLIYINQPLFINMAKFNMEIVDKNGRTLSFPEINSNVALPEFVYNVIIENNLENAEWAFIRLNSGIKRKYRIEHVNNSVQIGSVKF